MKRWKLHEAVMAVGGILVLAGSVSAGLPAATVSASGDSTSLMVVFGEAYWPGGYWDMPTGTTIQVRNARTEQVIPSLVGDTEPGVYEAIFLQSDTYVAAVGDTITFEVVDATFFEPNGYYVLTAADILAGMARYDVIPNIVSAVPVPGFRTGLTSLHPNPFNPMVNIELEIAESCPVELSVFDFRGHRVAVLAREVMSAGLHTYRWEGLNQRGEAMPSGVYLVRMVAEEVTTGRKITLVR